MICMILDDLKEFEMILARIRIIEDVRRVDVTICKRNLRR